MFPRSAPHLALAVLLAVLAPRPALAQRAGVTAIPDSVVASVDRHFAAFDRTDSPGCAVGIARDGRPVLTRAYGMANLEYGVPNTAATIFESGSVAKQFTAAALVLLARDGKLSLDDDVRKYIPEVPTLGTEPITIRHLLNHTSGLRDQWGLLGLIGRGPGSQVHSPATTVDLIAHQRALNFPPGSEHLYSNSGYTLAGVIVARVSGKSLDAFTQERLFQPLGMTSTQWRDDHTEIVRGRATAYSRGPGGFRTDMPFTDITGNGGLLTTVDDLLRWNEMLASPSAEWRAVVDSLEVRGRLRSGRQIEYALGVSVTDYDGVREVSHGGSTAGYRTFLARWPEQRLSVALLCNTATANAGALAHRVADLFLAKPPRSAPAVAAATLTPAQLERWARTYRDARSGEVMQLVVRNGVLASAQNSGMPPLTPIGESRFRIGNVGEAVFTGGARPRMTMSRADGDTIVFEAVPPAGTPTLAEYTGSYWSDELDLALVIAEANGTLILRRRPADSLALVPLYHDGFGSPRLGYAHFTRDATGRVTGFEVTAGRVRRVRFDRREGAETR
jgi:CubicO group peptidase (beta-lactamase class C family)